MKKIQTVAVLAMALLYTNATQAKSTVTLAKANTKLSAIKKKGNLNKHITNRVKNWDFIGLSTVCPDGAVMYAGLVGIQTDAEGNIIDVRVEYWGETVACEDHQLVHWI